MNPISYNRRSVDPLRQINMLTEDMKDLHETLAVEIKQTILEREDSYFGYMLVPTQLTDEVVINMLNYGDPLDKYFSQLSAQLNLDLVWYDDVDRHIMVWSETKSKTDIALWAINRWLEVGKPAEDEDEEDSGFDSQSSPGSSPRPVSYPGGGKKLHKRMKKLTCKYKNKRNKKTLNKKKKQRRTKRLKRRKTESNEKHSETEKYLNSYIKNKGILNNLSIRHYLIDNYLLFLRFDFLFVFNWRLNYDRFNLDISFRFSLHTLFNTTSSLMRRHCLLVFTDIFTVFAYIFT